MLNYTAARKYFSWDHFSAIIPSVAGDSPMPSTSGLKGRWKPCSWRMRWVCGCVREREQLSSTVFPLCFFSLPCFFFSTLFLFFLPLHYSSSLIYFTVSIQCSSLLILLSCCTTYPPTLSHSLLLMSDLPYYSTPSFNSPSIESSLSLPSFSISSHLRTLHLPIRTTSFSTSRLHRGISEPSERSSRARLGRM